MTVIDSITVAINADTSAFQREIATADKLARGFATSLGAAFSGAIVYGRSFNDVLSTLGLRLSSLAIGAWRASGGAGSRRRAGAAVLARRGRLAHGLQGGYPARSVGVLRNSATVQRHGAIPAAMAGVRAR